MNERRGILWFVLDEVSSTRLRQAVPPLFLNVFYHHVTLAYGITRKSVEQLIGKEWQVEVYSVAHTSLAQACRVKTGGLPDTYGVPHITLSTAPGVKPFASVAMLHNKHEERALDEPVILNGVIEFVYLDQASD